MAKGDTSRVLGAFAGGAVLGWFKTAFCTVPIALGFHYFCAHMAPEPFFNDYWAAAKAGGLVAILGAVYFGADSAEKVTKYIDGREEREERERQRIAEKEADWQKIFENYAQFRRIPVAEAKKIMLEEPACDSEVCRICKHKAHYFDQRVCLNYKRPDITNARECRNLEYIYIPAEEEPQQPEPPNVMTG